MLGLNKTADWCDEVTDLTQNKKLWVGGKDDGDESDDVQCLVRVKQLYEDIKTESEKMERFFKAFYYDIQDPKYDLKPIEFEHEGPPVNEQECDGVQKSAKDLPVLESTTSKGQCGLNIKGSSDTKRPR